MQVSLVRHGATSLVSQILCGRIVDPPLNDEGRHQADRAAAGLDPSARIWSSPRLRTQETAERIAGERALSVSAALDEIDFGAWAGRSFPSLEGDPEWERWNAARATTRPPGGEGFDAVADRLWGWIANEAAGESVIAVTHCDVIRALVCRLLGLSADDWWRFDVDCGSITRIAVDDGRARLISLNEVDR